MRIALDADAIKELIPQEVNSILSTDKDGEYILLDVRQPEEYQTAYIPGATIIPLGELDVRHGELAREKKIIVYCRSGKRSMAGAILLRGLGFGCVYNMKGGILSWPYQTIGGMPLTGDHLILTSSGLRDVLLAAIELESGSRDFYIAATDAITSSELKTTLRELAGVEELHMQRLYERAASLLDDPLFPTLNDLIQKVAQYMEGEVEVGVAVEKAKEQLSDQVSVLEIALEKEYRSYDFYRRTSVVIGSPDTRSFLLELAAEERNHSDIILQRIVETVRLQ
ncbi:MAG: rhodanese-like domain-containing protein [Chloroflexota bacterium]|nr:rhodanese-like domain-containing protein [Chloroflexota bacterium]